MDDEEKGKIETDSNVETPQGKQPYDPLVVNLPVYQGPFELLLDLITKNEMDIYNIQISVITDQYLGYLKSMKKYDLEIAGEFLVMAATLIYIKSKMLLPPSEEEDEEEGGDPRAELVRKLLEYQAFREAAKGLGMLEDERGKVFTRQVADYYLSQLSVDDASIQTFSADLYDLLNAFQTVLKDISTEKVHEVYEEIVTIEERIAELKIILNERTEIVFRELFSKEKITAEETHGLSGVSEAVPARGYRPRTGGDPKGRPLTKNLVIVTFLALLEMIRSKWARVVQKEPFGDILISKVS